LKTSQTQDTAHRPSSKHAFSRHSSFLIYDDSYRNLDARVRFS